MPWTHAVNWGLSGVSSLMTMQICFVALRLYFGVGFDTAPSTKQRNDVDEMRRSIPEDATLWVIKRIHSVQLKIRRSTLEKE
jgi:hypothetical protein